jgi:DNA-directed RNA polymerase subunit H (RpoH/RPB5)
MLEARGDVVGEWPGAEGQAEAAGQAGAAEAAGQADYTEYRTTNKKLETDRTVVFFALTKDLIAHKDKKSLMNQMKNTDQFVEDHGAKTFIIVLGDAPASAIVQVFAERDRELQAKGACLQYFTLRELQYNPSKHVLVPKHEKLADADVKQLIVDVQIRSKGQLPILLKTDVMARWLGLKHGDVVRITRINENSGISYYYRMCM